MDVTKFYPWHSGHKKAISVKQVWRLKKEGQRIKPRGGDLSGNEFNVSGAAHCATKPYNYHWVHHITQGSFPTSIPAAAMRR